MIENCTAVILAGGKSRRMGRDKAEVEFRGRSLLEHAIANLSPLFDGLVLSVREPRALGLSHVAQVPDRGDGRGPMMGIAAAMAAARSEWVFVTGVDMPFVVPSALQYMAARRNGYDAVLADIDGHWQPMPGFYATAACLPAMRRSMAQGRRSLVRLAASLNTRVVMQAELMPFDPGLRSFADIDTPEDLLRWRAAAERAG